MKDISPRRIQEAMSQAQRLAAELDSDDYRLLHDSIEGSTDVFELIDRIAEQSVADQRLVEIGKERLQRIEKRSDKARDLIGRMLAALGLDEPLQRPLYTASLTYSRKAIVTDEALVPEKYWRRSVDMRALSSAMRQDDHVPGVEFSNPQPSLRIMTR